MTHGRIVFLAATAALVACKAKEPTVPEGASKTWPSMSFQERAEHMGAVVMPRMKAHFQAFDATRFADFGCPTCHGAGAEDGSFRMPNPALPTLNGAGHFKKHRKESKEITHFMWKTVVPELSEVLGMPTRGLGDDSGIDCDTCHVVQGL